MKNKGSLNDIKFPFRTYATPFIKLLYAVIVSPLLIYLGERLIRKDELHEWLRSDNGDFAFWLSSVSVFFAIVIVSLVTTKLSVGVGLVGAAAVVVHAVHYFKLELRGEPFFPWDVFQYKEAANIMGDVNIEFTSEIWSAIIYVVLMLIGAVVIDILFRYPPQIKYLFRLGSGIVTAGFLYMYTTGVIWNAPLMNKHGINLILFDEVNSYDKGGFFITFMQNAENMVIKAPENYSREAVSEIAEKYEAKDGSTPNIICIMSEAFVNPDEYKNLKFDREITPVLNSLTDSYLNGMVLTPSYGGGTSISEYEVLTGNCASFLPEGTVPYMQYVRTKTDCYTSYLKNLGYTTVAIHPYEADFWCRNKAYPLMGFDKFLSQDDFEDCDYPRGRYISDMDLTKKIIEEYEAAKDDGPFFAFCVSMQNHASYAGYDYGDNIVGLAGGEGFDEVYSQLDDDIIGSICSYATGAYLADEALGALIDYFSESEEDTVIVFFGDHQPYLGAVDLSLIGLTSEENSEAENRKLTYTTPYVIWNNFGVIDSSSEDFSMYELMPYMTEKLGLSRPAYFEFLSEARETLAGHTKLIALDGNGSPTPAMTPAQQKIADEHWLLQYDFMFGKNYADIWR